MSKIFSKIIQWWELRGWIEIKQEWSGDTHCSWLVGTRGSLFSSIFTYMWNFPGRREKRERRREGGKQGGRKSPPPSMQDRAPALRAQCSSVVMPAALLLEVCTSQHELQKKTVLHIMPASPVLREPHPPRGLQYHECRVHLSFSVRPRKPGTRGGTTCLFQSPEGPQQFLLKYTKCFHSTPSGTVWQLLRRSSDLKTKDPGHPSTPAQASLASWKGEEDGVGWVGSSFLVIPVLPPFSLLQPNTDQETSCYRGAMM